MKNTIPILLTVSVILLIGAACQKKTVDSNTNIQQGTTVIQAADARAFGSLAAITGASSKTSAGLEQSNDSSVSSATPAPLIDSMPPPGSAQYTFTFTGTAPSLTDTKVDVYARTPGTGLAMPSDIKGIAGLGSMDFTALSNPTISSLNVRNGNENWYVDTQSGTVSMFNEHIISMIEPTAADTAVKTSNASSGSSSGTANANIGSAEVPVDTTAILRIASSFLSSHGISTTAYGTPVAVAPQVTYPLLINNTPVVQQDGGPMGMTLSVDQSSSSVTSLYGLNTLDFTSSAYDAVTDFSAIQKIAEQGGFYSSFGTRASTGTQEAAPTTTTVKLELGTPDRVLMSSFLYSSTGQRDVYVPAFRFPIVNSPDAYMKYVVVPLAKDLPTDTMPIGIKQEVPAGIEDGTDIVIFQR